MIHFNLIPKFCLAWLWRPPASYPTGTGGSFPGGKTAVKLTTHFHLLLKLRIRGNVRTFPLYVS